MIRFTRTWRRPLAVAFAGAGLLLLGAEEPLKGGKFILTGTTTGGGGRAGGGNFSVNAAVGQPSTTSSQGGNYQLTGGLLGVVVVPGEVVITVERTEEGSTRLTWPSTAVGFQLQSASQLGPQPDWKPVEPAPPGNVFLTPTDQPLRFFRLRKP